MRKLLYFFPLILIFITNSCDEEITSYNIEAKSYFPVNEGNKWNLYESLSDSLFLSVRILDEFISNNQKYYRLSFIEDESQADTISFENNIIYRHRNNIKEKWLDFNISNDQSYNSGDTPVKVKRNINVSTKLGEFRNCVGFYFDDPKTVDEEIAYFFAPDVGLVKIESWVTLLLMDYQLN